MRLAQLLICVVIYHLPNQFDLLIFWLDSFYGVLQGHRESSVCEKELTEALVTFVADFAYLESFFAEGFLLVFYRCLLHGLLSSARHATEEHVRTHRQVSLVVATRQIK